MVAFWKVIITIFLLCIIVADANRARRRRQTGLNPQPANQNAPSNTFNPQTDARQQPNPQILNSQGQQQQPPQQQQPNSQVGRQYYSPQNQYGSQGLNYYPYSGVGAGSQYGGGQYSPYGQGVGQYGQGIGQYGQGGGLYGQGGGQYGQYGQGMGQYGSYYQNQGLNNYNRPGYSSNYNPSGSNYGGGYYWNAGQKQNVNMFTVFLSSVLALAICSIAV